MKLIKRSIAIITFSLFTVCIHAGDGLELLKDDLASLKNWSRTTKQAISDSLHTAKTKFFTSSSELNKNLITAVRSGNVSETELLLKSGAQPEWTDNSNRFSALSYAKQQAIEAKQKRRGDLKSRVQILMLLLPAQAENISVSAGLKVNVNAVEIAVKSGDSNKVAAVLKQNPSKESVRKAYQIASDKSQREDTPAKDKPKFKQIKELLENWLKTHK